MPENEVVSKETEVALVGQKVEQLSGKVEELKSTFVGMVDDIHGHITREYNLVSRENDNKLKLAILESEKKTAEKTDIKISKSMGSIKTTIKNWSAILVATVICTAAVIEYFPGKSQVSTTTAQDIGELYKIISEEKRKDEQVIIKHKQVTP